jgi:hypothetical protein
MDLELFYFILTFGNPHDVVHCYAVSHFLFSESQFHFFRLLEWGFVWLYSRLIVIIRLGTVLLWSTL